MQRWPFRFLFAFAALVAMPGIACALEEGEADPGQDEVEFDILGVGNGGAVLRGNVLMMGDVLPAISIDHMVFPPEFPQSGNEDRAARAKLILKEKARTKISNVDQSCHLSDAQRQKLELAARADIHRLFDRLDALRIKARKKQLREAPPIRTEISTLKSDIENFEFGRGSFFRKTLHTSLTPEQFAKFRTKERADLLAKHRANITVVVAYLERGAVLENEHRTKVINLLEKEIPVPAKQTPQAVSLVLFRTANLPAEKLKAVLTPRQIELWASKLDRYRQAARQWEQQVAATVAVVNDTDDDAPELAPAAQPPAASGK